MGFDTGFFRGPVVFSASSVGSQDLRSACGSFASNRDLLGKAKQEAIRSTSENGLSGFVAGPLTDCQQFPFHAAVSFWTGLVWFR